MKTSELTGALLNYWVAMAGEEWKHIDTSRDITLDPSYKGVRLVTYSNGSQAAILVPNNPMRQDPREFDPAGDCAQGGPIIEREQIAVVPLEGKWSAFLLNGQSGSGYNSEAGYIDVTADDADGNGETSLIAAMRAFVASKYGDTVPDEVQS